MFYYGLSHTNKMVTGTACLSGEAHVVNTDSSRGCFFHSKFSTYFPMESKGSFSFPFSLLSRLSPFAELGLETPILSARSSTVMALGFCKHGSWSLSNFCQWGWCAEHCPAGQGLIGNITSHHCHQNELFFLQTFRHCLICSSESWWRPVIFSCSK